MWSEILTEQWKKKNIRAGFLAAFCSGMLCHLFLFTNILTNYDGLSRVYDEQQMTVSGRWFLHYTTYIDGFILTPMLSGTLAMLLLAVAAGLVIRLLDIRNPVIAALTGAALATHPSIAYTGTFTFTLTAYAFAILLAVWSVVIIRDMGEQIRIPVFLLGCILLALSMGTYQAYVAVAATLSILMVIRYIIDHPKLKISALWKEGMRYVGYLLLSAIVYYIVLRIFLAVKRLTLLSYRGMDQVAEGVSASLILQTIVRTYRGTLRGILKAGECFNTQGIVRMNILLWVAAALLVLGILKNKKLRISMAISIHMVVIVGLLPLTMNLGQLISPFSAASPTMQLGYVFITILPLTILDAALQYIPAETCKKMCFLSDAVCLVVFLSILQFAKVDNQMYTVLNQAHRSTLSFMTNLLGRIESVEGYEMGMDVYIIGGFPEDRYYADVESYDRLVQWGITDDSVVPRNKHMYHYLQDWMNVPIPEPEEEMLEQVAATETFARMSLYPNDGSVRMVDGAVWVKLQDSYTPKEQFEIDYEQRR